MSLINNRYPPFNGATDEIIMDKVKIGKFGFDTEEWDFVSKEAKEFITKMLEKDPKKRITVLNNSLRFTFDSSDFC